MRLLVFNLKMDADDDVLGFTTDWVNGLARHCEQVFVLTMCKGRVSVADNVQVWSVGKEAGYSEARRAVEFYRLLHKLLRTQRIDACFAHMMPLFAVMGWPLLRLRGIPTVLWYAHGHVPPMLRLAHLLVDRVVSSSPGGFRLPSDKLRIIGQGIDTTRFRPGDEVGGGANLVLLTVGRIAPIKRLELLIEALSLLPATTEDGSGVLARFVGRPLTDADHHYQERLKALAGQLGVMDRVQFLPAYPFTQIDRAYREADLFVNSSDTDSVDKTVLEAMASGLPVVTSNAAFRDVFDAGQVELFMVPKGSARMLAEKLAPYLRMPRDARRAQGLTLRDLVVRDHSIEALCARVMDVVNGGER